VHLFKALHLKRQKQYAAATQELQKALELNPMNSQAKKELSSMPTNK
jgi:hypothetical protein